MSQNEIVKDKKISRYEFKIVKTNDIKNMDCLNVELSINQELQELILKNAVVLTGTLNFADYQIRAYEGKRYLLKNFISNSISNDYKFLLVDKKLLNECKLTIPFETIAEYEYFLSCMRTNLKRMIEIIKNYSNINITLSYEGKHDN